MFVLFEPLTFLAWVFLSAFLPGAVLSFSIFKKDDFGFVEKLFMGFGLGMIILPLIPFLLYLVLGIKYSYPIALLSAGLLYLAALVLFVKNKAYEGMTFPSVDLKELKVSKSALLSLALVLIVLAAYMVRMGPYSPIFQELDPYYYTYTAHQLLTTGENPFDDQTAWYPELSVNHRVIPELSYLEAIWYSLYTGGGEYSNMLLALVASMYPPIAAALAVFFIYLLISTATKRKWGVVAAGIVSFVPVFIYKLSAGEHEVQPYAFFALAFFYAMYALAFTRKDHRFSVLAGLGFAAVALGSGSQILALVSIMVFMAMQAMAYFLRDKDVDNLRHLLISNSIVFAIGPLLGSAILKDVFATGQPGLTIAVPFFISLAFVGLLYLLKQKLPDRSSATMALAAVIVLGLIVYAATPLGDYVKRVGKSGFEIAKYKEPLHRTIAEQALAPASFSAQIGFMAETYEGAVSLLLWPLAALLGPSSQALAYIETFFGSVLSLVFLPVSILVNITLGVFVGLTNLLLDSDVAFTEKSNSLLLLWIFVFWLALAYSALKFTKKEDDNLFLFMLAVIMPPLVVGLIKAKYTIYSGALLAAAIGFSLGCAEAFSKEKYFSEGTGKGIKKGLLALGVALVFLQFVHNGFALSLLWGSLQPLYQNNPEALAPKFDKFCSATGDMEVCAAASDPMGYANISTNTQYSQRLCTLSIYSDYSYVQNPGLASPWEAQTAFFRCQRISDYWISSMEWIKDNTEEGSRIISWWDYGHWINFFGQRNSVLRNEHKSTEMIGAVAHAYLDATPEELKAYMKAHDSRYALFDVELIAGGGTLGGKYGALNYLSCAWNNETDVSYAPGESQCEADHLWETIFVSPTPCTISSLTNKTGFTAYKIYAGPSRTYLPYYPSICINPQDPREMAYCRDYVQPVPTYCVGEVMLATGESMMGTYSLNETYPTGDLKLNKALLQMPYNLPTTSHLGPVSSFTLFYTDDAIWIENGEVKTGYEDRKGKFYDSNLYRAVFMNSLPDFSLVYATPEGAVKIYEMDE